MRQMKTTAINAVFLFVCLATALGVHAAEPAATVADRILNFVVIPDAHTYTGHPGFLPGIVERINALQIQPDFVISLGDNIAGGEHHEVLKDALTYQDFVSRLRSPHYYVTGNHECIPVEVYKHLTWDQLLAAWRMKSRWYSFDMKEFHICVIDGWASLNTPPFTPAFQQEQEWFLQDLRSTDRKNLVFVHDAISFQQEDCPEWVRANNRKFWPPGNFFEKTIEANASKIAGVFEGHKHKSLHKMRNGVMYHQMGASFLHNGQFAQVFIDSQTDAWFVLGHPDRSEQDERCEIQQTYGDRRVMQRALDARARPPAQAR